MEGAAAAAIVAAAAVAPTIVIIIIFLLAVLVALVAVLTSRTVRYKIVVRRALTIKRIKTIVLMYTAATTVR